MYWATLLIFLFFTLSGSRRSYYVLPMVPFGILLTADWILSGKDTLHIWTGRIAISFYLLLALNFTVLQPLYYAYSGVEKFSNTVKSQTNKIKPWSEWNFVMLDPASKTRFYLQLPPDLKNNGLPKNAPFTKENLLTTWPILNNIPKDTIFITRKYYEPLLRKMLSQYDIVEAKPSLLELMTKKADPDSPVVFIPKSI